MVRLADKIFELEGFQRLYEPLLLSSIKSQFNIKDNELEVDLNYLLSCASIFADSNNALHLDVAYRIAQYALQLNSEPNPYGTSAIYILEKMTNNPTINLAIKKGLINENYLDELPISFKLEIINNTFKYSIWDDANEDVIKINKFQKEVIDIHNQQNLVSISAPTSAGKSFILLNIIKEEIESADFITIVYVVPTRALINQVERDITKKLIESNFTDIFITTMPLIDELMQKYNKRIFVLTQERLQWLYNGRVDFLIDFLIVDEAQKIDDGSRGVILQQVIEDVISKNPNLKVIFSSPMTKNPEIFSKSFHNNLVTTIQKDFVTVNQNLIWANSIFRKPKEWKLTAYVNGNPFDIGIKTLPEKANTEIEKIAYLAFYLAEENNGNLIYTKKPSEAEACAEVLYNLSQQPLIIDPQLMDLKVLIEETISPSYSLCKYIERGIAYHYGNMPLIIKNEVENLFKDGLIKFLVCTSTLIEGVNLPAKTIFIRSPKKGNSTPMTEIEFWNLAGRAGRQGLEFQGNIVCIDTNKKEVWNMAPKERQKYQIEYYTEKVFVNNFDDFNDYFNIDIPRIEDYNSEFEHTISYVLKEYVEKNNLDSINDLTTDKKIILENKSLEMLSKYTLPTEFISKHPGINPLSQQVLINFFNKNINRIQLLEPVNPRDLNAYKRYEDIIKILLQLIPFDNIKRAGYLSILALNWMNGIPLSVIVSKSIQYWRGKKNVQSSIRGTLKDIDEFARFKFIKYLSCYKDILDYCKVIHGLKVNGDLDDLNIWLELGASTETIISLIGLGFSRSTALELSKQIENENLNRLEILSLLKSINTDTLSKLIQKELSSIIELYKL